MDSLRIAESAIVSAIRRWRDRGEHLDPGRALWVVEGRHLGGESSAVARVDAPDRGAVVTVVPTARACRGLADYVRTCGLFVVDSPDPCATRTCSHHAIGVARMVLHVRSAPRLGALVPVELTIRSGIRHCWRSLVDSDDLAVAVPDAEDSEMRQLRALLEQAETTVGRLVAARLLRDCQRRIESAFAIASADPLRGGTSLVASDRCALLRQIRELLPAAVSGEPCEAERALAELRLLLDSLPACHDNGRRALGAAIGRVEFWRAAEPS